MAERRPTDTWKKRRAFMLVTVAFCMAVIVFVLWRDMDTGAAETAVSMAFVIIGTTVASYVFGAAWEDIKNFQTASRDSYYSPNEIWPPAAGPPGFD